MPQINGRFDNGGIIFANPNAPTGKLLALELAAPEGEK